MFPSRFDYLRPASMAQSLSALADGGDTAKLLAGGQSLIPLMKLRLAVPTLLIDIGGLSSLNYVRVDGDQLAIGAMTRHCDLERSAVVRRECPALAHVAAMVGDPQVRHRGTIGGSIAHADPASDLPTLMLALDGTVVATNRERSRLVPVSEFFEGFLSTVLAEDEILTEIRIPLGSRSWAYEKFTRRAQEWAIVGVAVARDNHTGAVRISLANAGWTPLRAHHVEAALAAGADFESAARHVVEDIRPSADATATVEYRRHLAIALVERALHEEASKHA